MVQIPGKIVVFDIACNAARLTCGKPDAVVELVELGFVSNGQEMSRIIADEDERLSIIGCLVKMGALFSDGHGWSPSELLIYLRDQGKLSGEFQRISWKGPNDFRIQNMRDGTPLL